jgi:ElaB/YqjD/DUF883 family membrane-anchored ribosome-binding protein
MNSNELNREFSSKQATEKTSNTTDNSTDELKEMLEGAGYKVKKKSIALKELVKNYTKEHPAESIVISVLTGAVVALLLRK